jgi:hypothetical protein
MSAPRRAQGISGVERGSQKKEWQPGFGGEEEVVGFGAHQIGTAEEYRKRAFESRFEGQRANTGSGEAEVPEGQLAAVKPILVDSRGGKLNETKTSPGRGVQG